MERMHMWSSFKILIEDLRLSSNVAVTVTKNRKLLSKKIFKKKSSPLKLLSQSQPNFAEMILGWSPSKIVSGNSDLRPRWPPQPNLI
jgi:hypothetical protein